MTERCHIRHGKHSKNKSTEWEFEKKMIEECILLGTKRIEKDSLKGNKIVSKYKGFEVVFKPRPCNWYLISATWIFKK